MYIFACHTVYNDTSSPTSPSGLIVAWSPYTTVFASGFTSQPTNVYPTLVYAFGVSTVSLNALGVSGGILPVTPSPTAT